jgi:hypothetical protein
MAGPSTGEPMTQPSFTVEALLTASAVGHAEAPRSCANVVSDQKATCVRSAIASMVTPPVLVPPNAVVTGSLFTTLWM